ncbi:MAG: deoxynucleoside kinase [Deltaproteobacteria bacterium]|nr:deoxynucleoside kinase [Deltaproteobacteria bacterium]
MGKRTYIAVAGNIGAGKSSLVDWLCRTYGVAPFFEPNEANPYLSDFYQDMKAWAFKSQLFFLTHKFRIHQELDRTSGTVVQDRTIYEDAEIFARALHMQRCIDQRDFRTYSELYQTILRSLRPPDLLIYLHCPLRTLRQRIAHRGRKMEQNIKPSYLRRIEDLYADWIGGYKLSPVLTIETGQLDYLTDLVHRLDVMRRIEKYL